MHKQTTMDRQYYKLGHQINWRPIVTMGRHWGEQWTWQSLRTEVNGGHSFVLIAAKWLASGTDDDDDDIHLYYPPITFLKPPHWSVTDHLSLIINLLRSIGLCKGHLGFGPPVSSSRWKQWRIQVI